jgi:hypothetical protein
MPDIYRIAFQINNFFGFGVIGFFSYACLSVMPSIAEDSLLAVGDCSLMIVSGVPTNGRIKTKT